MTSLAVLAGFLTVLGTVQACSTQAFGAGAAKVTASSKASRQSPSQDATMLTPQSGQSFNVLGSSPTLEDQAHADDPITGKPSAWQTLQYASPGFGRLKKGDGYLIDMGQNVKASSVEVGFAPGTATAQIYVSDTKSTQPGSNNWPQPGYSAVTQPAQVSGGVHLQHHQSQGRPVHHHLVHQPAERRQPGIYLQGHRQGDSLRLERDLVDRLVG
jgi:hypothetical protein